MTKLQKFYSFLILFPFIVILFIMLSLEYPTISGPNYYPRFFISGVIFALILLAFIPRHIFRQIIKNITRPPFPLRKDSCQKYFSILVVCGALVCYSLFVGFWLSTLISYYNQYNVDAPIEIIKTQVVSKKYSRRKGKNWNIYFNVFNGTRNLLGEDLYNAVEPGDEITLKVKKGRFDEYFALELIIEKSQSHYDLRGRV